MNKEIIALLIFLFTYLLIAFRRFRLLHIGRQAGAIVGATLMVVFGIIDIDEAYKSVDLNTIVLLFGMMVISEYLRISNFFKYISHLLLKKIKKPENFLTFVVFISGIGSAFMVNDTVCIIMTPIIVAYCVSVEVDALPFLIALATSSNIGSIGTLTGNPQNMLIGSYARLSYTKYFLIAFPLSILLLFLNNYFLKKIFERKLKSYKKGEGELKEVMIKKNLMFKSVLTLSLVVIFWFLGFNLSFTALVGASFLILITRISPQRILAKIDITILLFFAGLFVVIGAMEKTKLFEYFASLTPSSISLLQSYYISFLTIIFSNLFSNVPFVMIGLKWGAHLSYSEYFYYLLAVVSTLAGNLTILGSMANLIVVELAKGTRIIKFKEYLRFGFFITTITTIISVFYLFVVFKFILKAI